jgi:formylglycine-generating enzyme required for sulfatase activity
VGFGFLLLRQHAKPFGLSIHEVTRGQFRQFVDDTGYKTDTEKNGGGSGFKDGVLGQGPQFHWNTDLGFTPPQTDSHPVVNVSWTDAKEFCLWLSEKEAMTYRLPSEAEWEFACRSGNEGRYCFGDDVAALRDHARLAYDSGIGATQVGQKLPNALGLFDMHGNVWEFCQDWHGKYRSGPEVDPIGPEAGVRPIGRGGTWGGSADMCRSAFRSSGAEGAYSAGFRVARTLSVDGGR